MVTDMLGQEQTRARGKCTQLWRISSIRIIFDEITSAGKTSYCHIFTACNKHLNAVLIRRSYTGDIKTDTCLNKVKKTVDINR